MLHLSGFSVWVVQSPTPAGSCRSTCTRFLPSLPLRLRIGASRSIRALSLRLGESDAAELGDKYAATKEKLVKKYKGYLEGTVDTDGEVLPEWRVDNRQIKLEAQGITAASAPRRASEAIERTRKKYFEAFIADGNSPEKAGERVEEFLSNPSLCVDIIWAAERARFVEEEKGLDSRAKNWVTLGNLALLPFILLFLNSLPVAPSIDAAKFYLSNNCVADGGIKCNGVGAQGQTAAPNFFDRAKKALTPPANGVSVSCLV